MVVKVQAADMSERRSTEASDASSLNRQQRIARYKEERRRQLASQFAKQEDSSASTSSSGGGVVIRTTRTSRLRVAASSASDGQKSSSGRLDTPRRDPVTRDYVGGNRLQVTTPATSDASKEKSPVSDVSSSTGPKRERDKSSKRKSNLNRSLNAEEVPALDISEENGIRRRRRVATTPTLSSLTSSPANVKTPSTRSTPSPRSSVASPRPVTASSHPSSRSDRGSTPESDTPKSRIPRKISSSSSPNLKDSPSRPRPSSSRSGIPQLCDKSPDNVFSPRNELLSNHLTNGTSDTTTMFSNGDCSVLASPSVHHSSTVETLQVKHPWNGNSLGREDPPGRTSPESTHDLDLPELVVGLPLLSRPYSILKKKSIDESSPVLSLMVQNTSTKPVSILKRKTSQEEGPSTVISQPVTFSPSVVDPVSGRRQGILKKHRSLDEAEVVRRRSCSPDVDAAEFKPILKNQRRSSLEELVRRAQSPEPQSILKRKTSREENLEHSSGSEPQGILKRKSSSGSSSAPVHVTIAESVILAVGGAQETVYDEDHVRPILKKKTSSSEEPSLDSLSSCSETPKPILKKKSSSETDDTDEKHRKRPILKSRKDSTGSNPVPSQGFTYQTNLDASHDDDVREIFTECEAEVSKILDQSMQERDISPPPPTDRFANITFRTPKSPFDSEYSSKRKSFDGARTRSKDGEGTPRRPLSVAERVMNMEHFLALESADVHQRYEATSPTGAVPKRPRERERFRTQPVTQQELSTTQSWQRYPDGNPPEPWKSDESPSINPDTAPQPEMSETVGVRLSRSESVSARASLFAQLEKKATEEVKPKRLLKGSASRRSQDASRFSTHPVTSDEVEEAKRQNENKSNIENQENEDEDENDPSKLSLAERVSLFNKKMVTDRLAPARPRTGSRFKTQPITTEEVVTAQKMAPAISRAASGILVAGILKNLAEKTGAPCPKEDHEDSSGEEESEESEPSSPKTKRGILKSPSLSLPCKESVKKEPKSVLKKENEKDKKDLSSSGSEIHSILKVSKSKETGSDDSSATQSENSETDLEDDTPNTNSDLVSLLHKVEAQARSSQKISDDRFANVTFRKKPNLSLNINNKKSEDSDKVMNLKNLDQGKENRRVRKRADGSDTSEGDTSSSGGREIRRIIGNEAVARRRQAAIAKQAAERSKLSGQTQPLSKSKSQSAVQENNGRNMNGEVAIRCSGVEAAGPLRRCLTQPMGPRDDVDEPVSNGASIAQRLAALQKSGQSDWRKRISRLNPEEDLPTPKNISDAAEVLRQQLAAAPKMPQEETPASAALAERLGRLETASQGWKKRVAQSDAVQFSVAGRMALAPSPIPVSPLQSPAAERKKKTPKPNRFRSKEGNLGKEAQSMPTSPEPETPLTPGGFKRSISAPGGDDDSSLSPAEGDDVFGPMVSVPHTFDEDFSTFFSSASNLTTRIEQFEIRDEDLDELKTEANQLLVQRKTVKVQNRRGASSNPIKALAARSDLRTEYVEVKSGVAQRELRRINVEKLSKNSTLAIEALAGLASKEDFTAINLRKAAESTAHLSPMLPYNDLMLIQVKGRRHVQTRLVLPHYSSINQGDSYVLVTPTEVYHWIGEFSNVIERSRGAEITQNITQTRDLGSTATQAITLLGAQKSANHTKFWKLIGASDSLAITYTGSEAGHPDEDELYESAVTDTNMVYELQDDELIPSSNCWGTIPKIEILDPSKILVFDFGSEMYVWMGKNAGLDRRRMALKLGQELWRSGFDYSECDICPLNQSLFLGNKNCENNDEKKAASRPEWALLAKVTQHMETVLFREKFLDWPDFSRVIRTKGADDKEKQVDGSLEIKPCDAQEMVNWKNSEADLELEGSHLGRGRKYYDPETHRHYEIKTLGVRMWHIQEFESSELHEEHLGHFHTDDSYVIRWLYSITITGRELNGQPSRHSMVGRDRCAYFIWQGSGATVNDQGAAALLTVELDKERGPQIRVAQGSEPPAFKQLFNGGMSIHKGKLGSRNKRRSSWRLYLCRGEVPEEALLIEVTCSVRQLRSRASFILLNTKTGCLFIWHGTKSLPHTRKVAITAAENLQETFPAAAGLDEIDELTVEEITEGKEPKAFFDGLGGNNRGLYVSLANTPGTPDWTPRMFHLSSVLGVFKATPLVSPSSHSELTSPFPFLQQDLYSARQPALFLLDADKDIWLWQGWWGEETRRIGGGEEEENGGWGEVRWQAERRAAMSTAIDYWKLRHGGRSPPKAHLVWAGLEPLEFTNLFPEWTDRDDIAEVNIKDGRKPGEVLSVQSELARLTRSIYPPAQLLQRPLPDGVDPTRLENYLAPHHFQEMLGMSKEEFAELPTWKQTKLKKVVGLF